MVCLPESNYSSIESLHSAILAKTGRWIPDDAVKHYHQGDWYLGDIEETWHYDYDQICCFDEKFFVVKLPKWCVGVRFSFSSISGLPWSDQEVLMTKFLFNPATGEISKFTGGDSKFTEELNSAQSAYDATPRKIEDTVQYLVHQFECVQRYYKRIDLIKETIERLVRLRESVKYNRKNRRQSKYSKKFQREINKDIRIQRKLMDSLRNVKL